MSRASGSRGGSAPSENSELQRKPVKPGAGRSVRSYALRSGRISPAQARAVRKYGERWRLASGDGLLDAERVFGRSAPLILEIGFGSGEALLDMAGNMPERNFIGVDVYTPGIGQLFRRMAAEDADNIRIYAEDVIDVLKNSIPRASLDAAVMLFPDPWPKKRHHKRRLLQPPFLQLLTDRLRPGGLLQIATDWESYAEQIREHALQNEELVFLAEGRPPWRRCRTRFERRAHQEGRRVRELLFERRSLAVV